MKKILERLFKFIDSQRIKSQRIENIILLNKRYDYLEIKSIYTKEKTILNNLIIKFDELINDVKNIDVNEHHRERLINLCEIKKETILITLKT